MICGRDSIVRFSLAVVTVIHGDMHKRFPSKTYIKVAQSDHTKRNKNHIGSQSLNPLFNHKYRALITRRIGVFVHSFINKEAITM